MPQQESQQATANTIVTTILVSIAVTLCGAAEVQAQEPGAAGEIRRDRISSPVESQVQKPAPKPGQQRGKTTRKTAVRKTVRHPAGFELRLPQGWQVQTRAKANAGGADVLAAYPERTEPKNASAMILITAIPRVGAFAKITRPDDPRLRTLGLLPRLEESAKPKSEKLAFGTARVTEYHGSMQAGQGSVRARVHLWIDSERLVTCLAVAKAPLFAQHDRAFRAIAKSMRRSSKPSSGRSSVPAEIRQASRDRRLIGSWRNTNSRVVRGRPGESMALSSDIYCTLTADGRYRYGAGRTGFSSTTRRASTTGMTGRGKVETGYWKTIGNRIYIMRAGTKTWTRFASKYAISGRSMLLYYANGNKVLWER